MTKDARRLTTVLTGDPDEREGQFQGIYEAKIVKRTATQLFFTLVDEGTLQEFGPASYPSPYAHTHAIESGGDPAHAHGGSTGVADWAPDLPPVGTLLAVAFAGGDVDRPLVLTLYGWPS